MNSSFLKPSGYGRVLVAAKRRWPVIALLAVGVALFLTGVVSIGPRPTNKTEDLRRQQHKDLDEVATAIKTSVAAEVTATVKAAVAAEVATVRAAVAAEVTATIKAAIAAATIKASKPEAGRTKQLKFATATVEKAKPKAGSTKQLMSPPQSGKAGGTKQLKFAAGAGIGTERQVSNRVTDRTVSQFQPGTLNQSKIEVFKQCQLPNHSRGFDLQICGVAENRQWLWITTPKVASTTATRVWGKDGTRALQVGPACEVLAADQNGSDRQKIDQMPQGKDKFDGKTYNTSSVKFGFVRDPFDKLLSAVEEVMFRVLEADIDNFPGVITKEAFERARLTTMWDRTLRVGTSLIKSVLKNWDRTLEFGAKRGVWRGAWKGELSSSKAYKELVTANLQDYLQRLEQGDAQLPAWDVHFVPQTEWFSSHGLPFHNLRALMDITQRGPADQVSSMPTHF